MPMTAEEAAERRGETAERPEATRANTERGAGPTREETGAPPAPGAVPRALSRRPRALELLRLAARALPGDRLRTFFFVNAIARPRRALRTALFGFYRMEHVYDVLREFRDEYRGAFSILEFGVAAGWAFRKILYATHYLGMADRVTVHGFDTFAGLPRSADARDRGLVAGYGWAPGSFQASYDELLAHCRSRYSNFRLHRGRFEETLTDGLLASLRARPPMLVRIDCDYYSSARTALERLLPVLPSGCVVYFDDLDFNFGSRFTGEARLVDELNRGRLGEGVELVPDPGLSLLTRRVYRFVQFRPEEDAGRAAAGPRLEMRLRETDYLEPARRPSNDSPLP